MVAEAAEIPVTVLTVAAKVFVAVVAVVVAALSVGAEVGVGMSPGDVEITHLVTSGWTGSGAERSKASA